ncbi:ATP-binding cassette domain-containing protein [Vibrio sp. 10N.261.46.E12]|nr:MULTISPECIES: ABC transporter ATP-binding protein/permease [unclassified Vibrio]PMN93511.1 hypothetical protein BCT22_23625 [Vibrio sp. 10N.261.45.A1]OMO37208.1 hypothetical protein BH584_23725 [Vibrio sp. 10N.261.45.E1]PMJ34033.1 hypothetical protein BCU27_24860 [Vibrio sp. 10N.286.45.B6]PML87349.1 hypothetical protein BCT66_12405 [Vibrio sp. 10N.261.49.E11]PMM76312.1 hypothetical protein BCT48_24905 [Vibrio sp. 10N.261.46.F12]
MANILVELASEYSIYNVKKLKSKISRNDISENSLISLIESTISSELLSYKFTSGYISKNTKISEHFVVFGPNGYELIRYSSGRHISKQGAIDLVNLHGCRFFTIREVANVATRKDFINELFNFTPKSSLLLPLLAPMIFITPLYVNIYNSRLVYSNNLTTLFIISIFFVITLCFDVYFKSFIKNKVFKSMFKSSVFVEKYLLKLAPHYGGLTSVHSIKAIESYRIKIWSLIPDIMSECMIFIAMFVSLMVILPNSGVVFFFFYFLIFTLFFLYRARLYKLTIDNEEASNHLLNVRLSNLKAKLNIPFINKSYLRDYYLKTHEKFQVQNDKILLFNFKWDEMTRMVSFLSLILLFSIVTYSQKSSDFNPAHITLLFIICSRLSSSSAQIAVKLSYLSSAIHHIGSSYENLINNMRTSTVNIDDTKTIINKLNKVKIKSISIHIDGSQPLIEKSSLILHRGGVYGLKGAVGSGKSTFLQCLLGLSKPSEGSIEYDGIDINDLDSDFFSNHTSYHSSSEEQMFSGTLYDNFIYHNCHEKEVIDKILFKCFGGRDFNYQDFHVNDIESLGMSTGQKRKLLMMLNIFDSSKLYVFDEPFVNLPTNDIKDIFELIRDLSKDSIIIIASHSEFVLGICDVVYEINANKINATPRS